MTPVSQFAGATAIRRTGEGSYAAAIDPAWSIGGVPNGGYLLAILARAALDITGDDDPLTVSGHFTRPPSFGPAEARIEVVKRGRQVSTVRATLWQEGKPRLDTLISTGRLPEGDGPLRYDDRPAPDLPDPDRCPRSEHGLFPVALLDVVEERLDPATSPFRISPEGTLETAPTGTPTLHGWVRLADGADPDPVFLALACDALPPTVFNLGAFGWAPTVELTVLMRARPAPGWLRCETSTGSVSGGWFDEECRLWDTTGRLVAQSRQLALVGTG